jgi:hypothetical protein
MIDETTVQTDTEVGTAPEGEEHMTEAPHHEARKYRKRAQQAEQALGEARRAMDVTAARVAELEGAIAQLERRAQVDALLIEADAIDLEAARLLTEAALAAMDEPDVRLAVAELRRVRPYLFTNGTFSAARRGGGAGAAGAASALGAKPQARPGAAGAIREVHDAAAEAQSTGDRTDLLRYLRLRRTKPGAR